MSRTLPSSAVRAELRRFRQSFDPTDKDEFQVADANNHANALEEAVLLLTRLEARDEPRLAGTIEVRREGVGGAVEISIDGEPFPWLTTDGVSWEVGRGDASAVRIAIPAEVVSVESSI